VRHCIRLRKPHELRDQTDHRLPGTPDQIEALLADICFYAECVQGDAISKYARYASVYGRQFHRAYKLLQERPSEGEPEPEKTKTDRTKPISDNIQGNQRDTAIFTKPGKPHGPPKPAHNPGNQPREGRQ
ncbi:MAG: hypothetical protein GY953_05385, partial [bacterium]|nr:hypothetical protein [bacterium]